MLKHRGFPSRLTGTDYHFTLRRENKSGATKLTRRERFRDRRPADKAADQGFMAALLDYFGDAEFERGNLDAGRLSWLIGREVVAVGALDPEAYDQLLRIDMRRARISFPELFHDDPDAEALDAFPDDLDDGEDAP